MEDYKPIYSTTTAHLLAEEFKVVTSDVTYLDHAGATLYAKSQIDNVHAELTTTLFANPHSQSTVSRSTEDMVDQVRYQLLDFFGASSDEYSLIFTSGATAAIKLVGESFDYGDSGELVFLDINHTSVLGMRTYAARHRCLHHDTAVHVFDTFSRSPTSSSGPNFADTVSRNLFVYPAQCNFSGYKYPPEWTTYSQNGCLGATDNPNTQKWFCMVDAAAFASSNPLNLRLYKPDFVCLSFYKIFGYPTGLGCLLVRNSSGSALKKRYFGGGSVSMVLVEEDCVVHRQSLEEKFQDGSLSFLAIASLRHGVDLFKRFRLNMQMVKEHVFRLAKWVYERLKALKHFNGAELVVLYHDSDFSTSDRQGGVVNFNLRRSDGRYIGYSEVLHMANLHHISLRTGCFCNMGACQRHLHLSSEDVKRNFAFGHSCNNQLDLIAGIPAGSVRVSFGYMSTAKDANALIAMITKCFVERSPTVSSNISAIRNPHPIQRNNTEAPIWSVTLNAIYIYPIKSCAAFPIDCSWNLTKTGLMYDREWMIVTRNGVCLTQKHTTRMCLIRPRVDIERKVLILQSEGIKDIVVHMNFASWDNGQQCLSKVCGDKVQGWDCGDEVARWLDIVLERSGLRLMRQMQRSSKPTTGEPSSGFGNLSLANKAQFLLINRASVEWLIQRVPESERPDSILDAVARFRPNLLVDFGTAFVENDLKCLHIDNIQFVTKGQCTRCQMICIDQRTGEKTKEPLATISREFHGKIFFGMYLEQVAVDKMEELQLKISPSMKTNAIMRNNVNVKDNNHFIEYLS